MGVFMTDQDEELKLATDEIVKRLYRRFKDWSKRGFGPDDVTWCEVRADVQEMLNTRAPSPTASLVAALEFYADPFAWKKKHDPEDLVRIPDFYSETSFGDTAIEALAALQEARKP